jgi:signal transduction histidine kinase
MQQSSLQSGDWKRLFDAAPCGLVLLDSHALIQFLNQAAAKLLGLNSEQAVGEPLTSALPTWRETPLVASLPSLLDAQSTFESVDFDLPGPGNRHLRVCAAHVPGEVLAARGVVLTVVESTDVATLERRLHRAEYQASIGKLARGIAHELNSPLDGVLRYAHLALEQLTEDSPVREYLVHVKEGLDRMVRAVRAFLEFSRQVTTPVNRAADLNKLIEDALLLVQHRAKFQQVHIVKAFGEELPAVLDGGLQHAVVNLVKNAFDAMPRGGTLTITTRRGEGHVDVDIEDTGAGIPEEIRTRIFEPFFSTKPIHQGNGLGLIIAKEVVERSGGTIEFASQVGAGTTFRMHVPIAPSELAANGA